MILKIKDEQNNQWVAIPAIKGEKGDTPNLDGYATEKYVDDAISKFNVAGGTDVNLSEYAKKTDIPVIPTKVSAFTNDVGYLTQHQDLSNYATKTYVQNLLGVIENGTY